MNHMQAFWRRLLRIAAVVLVTMALVLVGGSYYATRHLTDNVSVAVQYSHIGPPEQIFATVIHDTARARRVREIFDAARPLHSSGVGVDCALPATQIYTYDFVFTWQNLTTESVHWEILNCAFIKITRWGNPFTQTYAGLSQNQYDELVLLTSMPADPRY